jgi:hypothetical protein
MTQIIQPIQTMRQRSFVDDLGDAITGFGNAYSTANAKHQETQRQQALAQDKYAMDIIQDKMTKQMKLSPEEQAYVASKLPTQAAPVAPKSGIGSVLSEDATVNAIEDPAMMPGVAAPIMGAPTQVAQPITAAPVEDEFSIYEPAKASELRREKELKQIQFNKAKAEADELSGPFENSRKAQELKYAASLKNKGGGGSANEATIYKNLPEDKKRTIETLATDNAKRAPVMNFIKAELDKWDTYTDAQKLTQGRALIKPLNSLMGSDAVGAEEVKRLAANLEYAMGNLTNDNPTHFGRNLDGFKQQVMDNLNSMQTMVKENQKIIDEAYGRKPNAANPVTNKNTKIQKAPEEMTDAELDAMLGL